MFRAHHRILCCHVDVHSLPVCQCSSPKSNHHVWPVQVNVSQLLTGLGDGSLLGPHSALASTVQRSDLLENVKRQLSQELESKAKLLTELHRVQAHLQQVTEQLRHSQNEVQRLTWQQDADALAAQIAKEESTRGQQSTQHLQQRNFAHELQRLQINQEQINKQHQEKVLNLQQQLKTADEQRRQLENTLQRDAHAASFHTAQFGKSQCMVDEQRTQISVLTKQLHTLQKSIAFLQRDQDVPSFETLCTQGRAVQLTTGEVLPGNSWDQVAGAQSLAENCSDSHLLYSHPEWVHTRARKELRRIWMQFKERAIKITGWDIRSTSMFTHSGGKDAAILAHMLCYHQRKDSAPNHGTFRLASLLTGLLTSMPAKLQLQELASHNVQLARVLRTTIGPVLMNPPHQVAAAIRGAGVTRRQAEAVIRGAVGPTYGPTLASLEASLQDLSKASVMRLRPLKRRIKGLLPTRTELQTENENVAAAMTALFGARPTGTTGAHVTPLLALPTAVDLMPGSVQVQNRLAHSAAQWRRACLIVGELMRKVLNVQHMTPPPLVADTDTDPDHFVHVRVTSPIRDVVLNTLGYSLSDWTRRSWSLSVSLNEFENVLRKLFRDETATLPNHAINTLFIGTLPNGCDSLLLHQLDRLLAELIEVALLPDTAYNALSACIPAGGGCNYATSDPMADCWLDAADEKLLDVLRSLSAKELGVRSWPGVLQRKNVEQEEEQNDMEVISRARERARHAALYRMLCGSEQLIFSIMFDGAKMSNGPLRQELLQTVYHVMFPPLQVPLLHLVHRICNHCNSYACTCLPRKQHSTNVCSDTGALDDSCARRRKQTSAKVAQTMHKP